MKHNQTFFTRFRKDEAGSASVELMLVVPMLVWALLSTIVYFDAYHAESISTRAGLTLADLISREQNDVDLAYITNLREVLRVLTDSDADPDIRATVYRYDEAFDANYVVWSEEAGYGEPLDDEDLENLRFRIPLMANANRSILVETRTAYSAPFSIGIGPFLATRFDNMEFRSFTVISPRFLNSICFDPTPGSPGNGDEEC